MVRQAHHERLINTVIFSPLTYRHKADNFYASMMNTSKPKPAPAFRWSYIVLPLAILAISITSTAVLSLRLPAQVAYHFDRGGSPDGWVDRNLFILVTLLTQFVFTLLAASVTWGMGKLSARLGGAQPAGSTSSRRVAMRPESIIRAMGNMLAMPQIVLAYAVLDIFVFNAFQVRLMPLWLFAVIVMVGGGVFLGIFFARAFRQSLRPTQ